MTEFKYYSPEMLEYCKKDTELTSKLAKTMEEKGFDPQISHEEKVQRLMDADDLDVVEKAIDLSAPQFKLASVSDNPGNASDALGALELAIME